MAIFERKNPSAKNFGLGSKNLFHAGRLALREGMASHASRAAMTDRWSLFAQYARQELGLRDMRKLTTEHLRQYADHLHILLDRGEIAASTAQNRLSTVNRVMEIARGDRAVRLDPVRGAGLPQRSGIAMTDHAMSAADHEKYIASVPPRLAAQLGLQRELGLRFEESCKASPLVLLAQAEARGVIRIEDGTKGGRARDIQITSERQLDALREAAAVQGTDRSMIPADQSYARYRELCYQQQIRYHSERHAYAQQRYETLAGAAGPVAAGVAHGAAHHAYLAAQLGRSVTEAREIDRSAREQVAAELGHGRIDVTNSYLG